AVNGRPSRKRYARQRCPKIEREIRDVPDVTNALLDVSRAPCRLLTLHMGHNSGLLSQERRCETTGRRVAQQLTKSRRRRRRKRVDSRCRLLFAFSQSVVEIGGTWDSAQELPSGTRANASFVRVGASWGIDE